MDVRGKEFLQASILKTKQAVYEKIAFLSPFVKL